MEYTLHWGEDGPKHADAWVEFTDLGGETRITLGMIFASAEEYSEARGFGATQRAHRLGQCQRNSAQRRRGGSTSVANQPGTLR